MTRSPANDDGQRARSADETDTPNETAKQVSLETPRELRGETLHSRATDSVSALPDDLSSVELAQAKEAIAFLNEVRSESQQPSQLPSTIGKYSIVRSLGRGGFAEVFLAEDEELDRRVALKVPLFNSTMNEAGRQRFAREAKLAASLGHPQIVPVYEYGDLGAIRFIAFAWCDGPTLDQWIADNGPVDPETAAKITERLARAVEHAHQRGIVHRDLKPGNVLVDASEQTRGKPVWERVRITDFGLARNFDNQDVTLTQEGQLVGTPAYMAPEQASSETDVGPSADVWALGMILFELLTGKLPFRRPEILASIKAICDEPVPKAKKLKANVPAALDAIADLSLRKKPSERYESAHQLAEDLRRWSSGEPVRAKPQSLLSTFVTWNRRNPILASLIGLTIASLSIGLGVAIWQRSIAIANLNEAVLQTERADANLEEAIQQTERADDNLAKAQGLINDIVYLEKNLGREMPLTEERAEMLMRASRMQVALIKDEERTPQVRYSTAMTFKDISQLLTKLGNYDGAIANAQYVLEQLEGLEDDLPPKVTHEDIYKTRMLQRLRSVEALNNVGEFDEAMEQFEANESEPIPEDMDPFLVTIIRVENLRGRSLVATSRGDLADSAIALQLALDRLATSYPSDNKKQLWDWSLTQSRLGFALADMKIKKDDWDCVEDLLTECEKHLNKLKQYFPNHPMIQQNEGDLLFRFGQLHEGQEQWNAAVERFENSRKLRLSQLDKSPKFPPLAYSFLASSLALARCHQENGSPESCLLVAKESVGRAASFPEKWNADPTFKQNLLALERFAEGRSVEKVRPH